MAESLWVVTVDARLMEWIAAHRGPHATDVAQALMAGSDGRVLGIAMAIVFAIGIALGQVAALWTTVAAAATASAVATALKDVIDRARPPAELALVTVHGSSMPSTVAALVSAGAITLVLTVRWPSAVLRRLVAALAGTLVLLICAAMLYLGAHWLTDVLAGWLIGGVVAAVAVVVFARLSGTRIAL